MSSVHFDRLLRRYREWKTRFSPIVDIWQYLIAAVTGIGLENLVGGRWFVIILSMLGLGVLFTIVVLDYEKSRPKKLSLFFRPWGLLFVFVISALSWQCYKTKQFTSEMVDTTNSFHQTIYNLQTNILDLTNTLNQYSGQLSTYRGFDTRYDDLGFWGYCAFFHTNYSLSKEYILLSFDAEGNGDIEKVGCLPILAADKLMLNQSPAGFQQFSNDIDDMVGQVQSHKIRSDTYTFWTNEDFLATEIANMQLMIPQLPAQVTNYIEETIEKVRELKNQSSYAH